MKRWPFLLLVTLLGLVGLAPSLRTVTLEWDPSPDSWVAGYAIHYGQTSSNYTVRVEVGTNLTCTISNLVRGQTYYFVATAYTSDGQESLPSNEVAYTVPSKRAPWTTNAPGLRTNLPARRQSRP